MARYDQYIYNLKDICTGITKPDFCIMKRKFQPYLDYNPIDVDLDCSTENGTCTFNAVIEFSLTDFLTSMEIRVNVRKHSFDTYKK